MIVSIITGIKFASDEEVNKSLEYLSGDKIDESNNSIILNKCKDYILEQYDYLKNINVFINDNVDDKRNELLFDLISKTKRDVCKIKPITC